MTRLRQDASAWPRRRWQSPEDRLVLVLEIVAVVALAVLPYLAGAVIGSSVASGGHRPSGDAAAWWRIAIIVQITLPLLFIMWRSGVPWAVYGIVRPRPLMDSGLGALVCVLSLIVALGTSLSIWFFELVMPGTYDLLGVNQTPTDPGAVGAEMRSHPWVALGAVLVLNAFAEELFSKAYLIPRLRQLTGNRHAAVVISAGLFASYHIYQGVYATIVIFFVMIVLGWLFLRLGRLWPFVIGHAAYDVLALALMT